MNNQNIRWKQRFSNYQKAMRQLQEFIDKGDLSRLEKQGLIQAFEYTYELAWNTLKDFYENQGEESIQGSRDAIRLAFKRDLIKNGNIWMNMIKDRSLTSHTYNEDTAKNISESIVKDYYSEFITLEKKLNQLANKE